MVSTASEVWGSVLVTRPECVAQSSRFNIAIGFIAPFAWRYSTIVLHTPGVSARSVGLTGGFRYGARPKLRSIPSRPYESIKCCFAVSRVGRRSSRRFMSPDRTGAKPLFRRIDRLPEGRPEGVTDVFVMPVITAPQTSALICGSD